MTRGTSGPTPGVLARAEQQYTGCQRMLDHNVQIAGEAAHRHGAPPAQVWATVVKDLVDGQTPDDPDDPDEDFVALAGVFAAAVVEVLEGRSAREP